VDAVTIEQVADALRQLAAWSPKPEQAKQAAQTMLDDYALLKSQYANKPKKRVFLQFGANPLFTSGKGSIQHEVLRYAAEKTSLPVVGFPGRRLAVSRSWHEPPGYCCNRRSGRNSEN
jgi:ABC-type Fe3+-hydroxamate transport system substrate-binding protein